MENNKNLNTETTIKNENKNTKNISFKLSKDYTKEDIAKLPKVTVKLEKKTSSNKKSVNYVVKAKLENKAGKKLILQHYVSEVVAELLLHAWGKAFDNKGFVYEVCSIRFSTGEKEGKRYWAYDLFLTNKRRIFAFLSEDDIEFINTFGFEDVNFEERVYFDEDGYEFKPDNF